MRTKSRLAALPFELIAGRDGAVAMEFALIFPVMFTLFMGSIEITNLLMANLKTTAATEAASDLVAQTRATANTSTKATLHSYYLAAGVIMSPYPTSGTATPPNPAPPLLKLAFASIVFDAASNPSVGWHYEENGAPAITTASLDTATLKKLLENTTTPTSDSVVMVKTTYVFNSPISFLLAKTYTFTDIAYNHPRYVPQVACTDCAVGG